MNRRTAFLILAALWAAIYLPGLGSTEIKGEEGRRILPAVAMLESGNWLVPHVGGKPFLRKPPLVNWAIAGSFAALGRRDEWAARLPSALAVLALCGAMIAASGARVRTMFTTDVMFIASVFAMTGFGLLAKARFAGAEIEGIYVPLCGIATVLWLAWWEQGRARWLVWTVPWIFLGLAALAKAPLHLLFFYAMIVAVLWRAGELRRLREAPHLAGVVIMVGIFACWAVPYFLATQDALGVWKDQFAGRVTANRFDLKSYLLNLPRGLGDQLPWLLFAPVLWLRRNAWTGREGALVGGSMLAVAICFVALLLIPGVLTRYVLPLGVPFALLLALAVGEETLPSPALALRTWWRANSGVALGLLALACAAPLLVAFGARQHLRQTGERLGEFNVIVLWPLLAACAVIALTLTIFLARRRFARPTRLAGASAALCGGAAMLYAAAAVPFINRADNIRPLAAAIDAAIDAAIPIGRRLVVFDPEYQPALFYVRTPFTYAADLRTLPRDAEYVLARAGNRERLGRERPELITLRDFGGRDKNRLLLLQRRAPSPNDAPAAAPQ